MRNVARAVVGIAAMVTVAVPASAQLCAPAANPCVVSANVVLPSGTIVDIGTRDLVIQANKTITVTGFGFLIISARNVTLEDSAKIIANGQDGFGGDVTIDATGSVVLRTGSRIDVQSASAGDMSITAASLQLLGQLRAGATARDGDGGLIDITTTGNVSIGGAGIEASGGDRFSSGGLIDIIAGGTATVSGPIVAKGGDGDGGDIDIDAALDVTTTASGELRSNATYPFGSGGATTLTAGRSVTLSGPLYSRGQGDAFEGGGDGGDLDVSADGGDVLINGELQLDGSAPDGSGGFLDVFASGSVVLNSPIGLTSGREGGGGDVLVTGDDVLVNGPMTLQAGFIGGFVDFFATTDVTFTASGDVDVSADDGPYGEFAGIIDVTACSADVQAGTELLAIGNGTAPRASIRIRGTHSLRIAGTVRASALVQLTYKDALPIFVPGFLVLPTPVQIFDQTLPCCFACNTTTTVIGTTTTTTTLVSMGCGDGILGPGEVCDDGNPFDGDCCSSVCTFEPGGQACADDGNVCTRDFCTGLGVCEHRGDYAGTLCRPAIGACDVAETCTGFSPDCPPDAAESDGTACSDDECLDGQECLAGACDGGTPVVCAACEACDPSIGCVGAPRDSCRETILPGKSSLIIKRPGAAAKNKLIWKWTKGQTTELADYGDPTTTDGFALCLFDPASPTSEVIASASMPGGGLCPDKPCWRATSSGYKYRDKVGDPDGVSKLVLKARPDGGAAAVLKSKGELLSPPPLPLAGSVRVQLQGVDGCWEARFSPTGTKRNDDTVFKAQSD